MNADEKRHSHQRRLIGCTKAFCAGLLGGDRLEQIES